MSLSPGNVLNLYHSLSFKKEKKKHMMTDHTLETTSLTNLFTNVCAGAEQDILQQDAATAVETERQSLVLEQLENVLNTKGQATQGETTLCEWAKHPNYLSALLV